MPVIDNKHLILFLSFLGRKIAYKLLFEKLLNYLQIAYNNKSNLLHFHSNPNPTNAVFMQFVGVITFIIPTAHNTDKITQNLQFIIEL
jgi:hypothetical protein